MNFCLFLHSTHTCTAVFKPQRPKIFRGSIILTTGISEQIPESSPLIFKFKNFGEFQKLLISLVTRPEMHYLDAILFCMQLTNMQLTNAVTNILIRLTFGEECFDNIYFDTRHHLVMQRAISFIP